jgi:hypothetical protein
MSLSALKDPGVWSALVAILALVLSQLPPIRELLTPSRVRLSLSDRLVLSHFLGNINLMALVTVENLGSRKQTVAKLDGILLDSSGGSRRLPAQQYVLRTPSPAAGQPMPELLMAGIHLKRDEVWSETVRFFRLPSEDEEGRVGEIASQMEKSIRKQAQLRPPEDQKLIEAEPGIVADAMALFKDMFRLSKGNYTFLIAALSDSGDVLDVQGVEFTVYESAVQSLRSATEDYRLGWGVCYPTQSNCAAYPRLRPIPSVQAKAMFQEGKSPRSS